MVSISLLSNRISSNFLTVSSALRTFSTPPAAFLCPPPPKYFLAIVFIAIVISMFYPYDSDSETQDNAGTDIGGSVV